MLSNKSKKMLWHLSCMLLLLVSCQSIKYNAKLPILGKTSILKNRLKQRTISQWPVGSNLKEAVNDFLYSYIEKDSKSLITPHKPDLSSKTSPNLSASQPISQWLLKQNRTYYSNKAREKPSGSPFTKALNTKDWVSLLNILRTDCFASTHYRFQACQAKEKNAHAILDSFLRGIAHDPATGLSIRSEEPSAQGRADLVIEHINAQNNEKSVYIFELKLGKTSEKAFGQIIKKSYHDKFCKSSSKCVTLIGLNLVNKEDSPHYRNINQASTQVVYPNKGPREHFKCNDISMEFELVPSPPKKTSKQSTKSSYKKKGPTKKG